MYQLRESLTTGQRRPWHAAVEERKTGGAYRHRRSSRSTFVLLREVQFNHAALRWRFDLVNSSPPDMLRYLTAGESHGKAIVALIDGFPAGVVIDTAPIDVELRRRQGGYGRGGRQRIETDTIEILSGLWHNTTLGSPIALQVVNKDAKLERLEDLERRARDMPI